jgi:hypothetical protein
VDRLSGGEVRFGEHTFWLCSNGYKYGLDKDGGCSKIWADEAANYSNPLAGWRVCAVLLHLFMRAQQGGTLTRPIGAGNQNHSVACFQCLKYFRLPQTLSTDPWPVQCTHCGYAHTSRHAKAALWPAFQNGRWIPGY